MDNHSIAIKVDSSEGVYIGENDIQGFGTAIEATNSRNVDIKGNIIRADQQEIIIDEIISRLQKEKSNTKVVTAEKLLDFISQTASSVISEICLKSMGIK